MASRLPSAWATSQWHFLHTVQLPQRVLRDGQVSESNYSAPCEGWSHSLVQPTIILPSPREILCHSRLDLSALSQTTQKGPKGHPFLSDLLGGLTDHESEHFIVVALLFV